MSEDANRRAIVFIECSSVNHGRVLIGTYKTHKTYKSHFWWSIVRTRRGKNMNGSRLVKAPRGDQISCKGWPQEAAMRMLMNNLDPEVAERPDDLVVYGGAGKAARDWQCFDAIVRSLRDLNNDETLLVQSGKPVGIFRTHEDAPRVLIANSNLVGHWSNWNEFHRLERMGLTMYGQM